MKPVAATRARLRIRTQPTSGEFPRLGEVRAFRLVLAATPVSDVIPDRVIVAGDGSVVAEVDGKAILRFENLAQLLSLLGLEELELEEE